MYITITFERSGKIGVYVDYDGTMINISTEANNLRRMLPSPVYDAVVDRLAQLLDTQTANLRIAK